MKNLKRFLSCLLAVTMLLALGVTASAAEFTDVPDGSDYAEAIQWAADNGYINGYSDGRFGVNDNVTRAQLATIFHRAAGTPAVSGTSRFSDAVAGAYYADALIWAEDNGLINGYLDGRFGIDDPVTRQQAAAILWRWAGSPAASAGDYADESSIAEYAQTAVDWSRSNGIIAARGDGRFAPNDSATRGEIVSALYNYMGRSSTSSVPSESNGGKVLVVYFSASNNTEAVAQYIANELNADLFEITPADPYTSADLNWTDPASRVNDEHDNPALRDIELVSDTVENWDSYDTVFIGYPIWWGIAAWPTDSFVKANDFTGKTVIPFCTSSSSGLGESGELLAELAGTGTWLDGQRFRSGASESDVQTWVRSLNLPAVSVAPSQPEQMASKSLVVYFSMPETTNPNNMTTEEANSTVIINGEVLGNTQYMAYVIQEQLGADIFRIEPEIPYPTDHTTLVAQAREEQSLDARPAIQNTISGFEDYDTVFIGYPIWWSDMPQILYTFFDSYDFSGKTIIPFSTHGGSSFAGTPSTIQRLEPNAAMLDGLTISRDNIQDARQEIINWVNGLDI